MQPASREGKIPMQHNANIRRSMQGICSTCAYASDWCKSEVKEINKNGGYLAVLSCTGYVLLSSEREIMERLIKDISGPIGPDIVGEADDYMEETSGNERIKQTAYWLMHDCANPQKKRIDKFSYPISFSEYIISDWLDGNEILAEVFNAVAANISDEAKIGRLVKALVEQNIYKCAEFMENDS